MAHPRAWLAAVAAFAMVPMTTPSAVVDNRLALAPMAGGLWTVAVTLDQEKRLLTFVVNTGSARSVVSRAAAMRAGLPIVDGARLDTPAGTVDAGETVVPRLVMGRTTAIRQRLLVANAAGLGRVVQVDGILGMDLLAARDVVLDFDRGLLTLADSAPGPSAAGVSLPMRWAGGRVVLDARIDGRERALVLDTGAQTLVVFGGVEGGTRGGVCGRRPNRRRPSRPRRSRARPHAPRRGAGAAHRVVGAAGR